MKWSHTTKHNTFSWSSHNMNTMGIPCTLFYEGNNYTVYYDYYVDQFYTMKNAIPINFGRDIQYFYNAEDAKKFIEKRIR